MSDDTPKERPLNSYELKQEMRRERLERAAANAGAAATAHYQRSHSYTDGIPMGQPILVGHHSEKRHRNALKKSDNAMRKGWEESKRADELAARASAVGTGGISSDDPDAITKLTEKLQTLMDFQAHMVAANKLVRKAEKRALTIEGRVELVQFELSELGFGKANMIRLFEKDFAGRTGYPDYALQNNNANIKRIQARIKELSARPAKMEAFTPIKGDGWELGVDADENRVYLEFAKRLTNDRYKEIRSYGFVYSKTYARFQRKYSNAALYYAKKFVGITEVSAAVDEDDQEEEPTCSAEGCESTDVESTPCGSFCHEHLQEHMQDCEICRNEFA